jgi:hypothetical protein
MTTFIVYIVVGFIMMFFLRKKYLPSLLEKKGRYSYSSEFSEFWIIYGLPLIWPISLPLYFLWFVLEVIYKYKKD